MGIDRTMEAMTRARIVLLVVDAADVADIDSQVAELGLNSDQCLCVVQNKTDLRTPPAVAYESLAISAKTGQGLDALRDWLTSAVDVNTLEAGAAVVSNARHYEALVCAAEAVERVLSGIDANLPADLLAEDIREVLHHLGTITGEVTTDEILGTIFSRFCVGK